MRASVSRTERSDGPEATERAGAQLAQTLAAGDVVLVSGELGAGKTTFIGKLATRLRAQGQRVLVGAGNTFRAGAIDQLRVWAERSIQIGMDVVRGLYPSLQASQETLAATDAWLGAHEDAAPALRRLVLEARDDLARGLRGQARDAAAAG